MMKKITKKEMFTEVIAKLQGEKTSLSTAEMIDALQHEIELLEKKASGKNSDSRRAKEIARQVEDLALALEEFDKPISISEFQKNSSSELASFSNQKLSALMKKLIDTGKVIRTMDKKRAVFQLTEND